MPAAPPSKLAFQTRSLMIDDDGAAFQQFVWEALSVTEFEGSRLVQHPVRGRDGAIDLVDESGRRRTVLECKYHGESRTDTPARDWRAVFKTLEENLPALCDLSEEDRRGSPYAPWLASERSITEYWFCTSATLANENAVDALQAEIQRDMAILSRARSSLSHLEKIKVVVRAGQHFVGLLTLNLSLRYRWFGGFPRGFAPIVNALRSKVFRNLLISERLPYFSVGAYEEDCGRKAWKLRLNPDALLDRLLSGDRRALVISGPGGVGKTRLGLEIARAAEAGGVIVLACNALADDRSIEELVKSSLTGTRAILFVDYAENQRQLAMMAAAIATTAAMGHDIRIVATCRASAANEVIRSFDELLSTHVRLSSEQRDEDTRGYLSWVARKILTHGGLEQVPGLARICDCLPVLAAFALHLKASGPESFDRLFSGLAADETFEAWAGRRIAALTGASQDPSKALRIMSLTAACLPMTAKQRNMVEAFDPEIRPMVERLLNDGWFDEDEQGVLTPSHDVFVDALIAAYLFETGRNPQFRTQDALRWAMTNGALVECVRNIDRLAAHPRFREIDGFAAFRGLGDARDDSLVSAHEAIALSSLMHAREFVSLCDHLPDIETAIVENPSLFGRLVYIAKEFMGPESREVRDRLQPSMVRILKRALRSRGHITNMLLRRAFEVDPQEFRDEVLSAIQKDHTSLQSHFLIVAWLKADVPRDEIRPYMQAWLAANSPGRSQCSFVIAAWLASGGQESDLRGADRTWLRSNIDSAEAAFVISAISRWGVIDNEVRSLGLKWLADRAEIAEAGLVLTHWKALDDGQCDLKDFPLRWIVANSMSDHMPDVIFHINSIGYPVEKLLEYSLAWMSRNGASFDAIKILQTWIALNFDEAKVSLYLYPWLKEHGRKLHASYLYSLWFDRRLPADAIAEHVVAWIEENKANPIAGLAIRWWINAGWPPQRIESLVGGYLALHFEDDQLAGLIGDWLDAEGSYDAIREPVRWWMQHNVGNPIGLYNLRYITRINGLDLETLAAAVAWCWLHQTHPETITRITPLFVRYGRDACLEPIGDVLMDVLERIEPEYLDDWSVQVAVLQAIPCLGQRKGKHLYKRVQDVHLYLALSGRLYGDIHRANGIAFLRSSRLIKMFLELVRHGDLDPIADGDVISNLRSWVGTWPVESQQFVASTMRQLEAVVLAGKRRNKRPATSCPREDAEL